MDEFEVGDIKSLLELALTSDVVRIGDNFYKQTSGIAMGNNISPFIAIIYIHSIEVQILAKCNIRLWKRYWTIFSLLLTTQ